MDLGVFSSNLNNIYNEEWRAFSGHIQPLMFLFGLVYQVFDPNVATLFLVMIQSLTILGSIWWVWREFGFWPSFAMLLYYPLWANVLFDFHFDHLLILILTAFFIFCEQQKFKLATLMAASLILIKEPYSLQVIFCGIYLIWLAFRANNRKHFNSLIGFSIGLIVLGVIWYYVSMYILLPYFSGVEGIQGDAYSWLGTSTFDKMYTVVLRPDIWILDIINNPDKLKLLFVIFGLLVFIPLLRPAALIVAIPPLLIMLLSHEANYYSYAHHYTAGVIIPVIIAFKDGLPIASKVFKRIFLFLNSGNKKIVDALSHFFLAFFLLFGHWALASSPISRLFWSDKVWSYSWQSYTPTKRDSMIKEALLKHIPSDSEISVSTQNSLNYGHLSSRKLYLPFPQGVIEPHLVPFWSEGDQNDFLEYVMNEGIASAKYDKKLVDYVVLDSKRPWFVVDQGCDWIYGKCTNEKVATEYLEQVKKSRKIMDIVFEKDGFLILKRADNDT